MFILDEFGLGPNPCQEWCVREIPLLESNGAFWKTSQQVALVSNEDYKRAILIDWRLEAQGYARAPINGKQIRMHQFIFPSKIGIDHKDRNKLMNTKSNLQEANKQKNGFNRHPDAGISFRKGRNTYMVRIEKDGAQHYIGTDRSLEGARLARTRARKELGIDL